jgi:hypothetical protein
MIYSGMTGRELVRERGRAYLKQQGTTSSGSNDTVHIYDDCGALRSSRPDELTDESEVPLRTTVCERCLKRYKQEEI